MSRMRSSAGIFQAGHVAAHLAAHELLVDAELANAAEHAGEGEQHAPDVVGGVHVSGVEAGDHRVQPLLLFRCERAVRHRDVRIGEAVVIQRRVGVQVIGGRVVPGHTMAPLLLQGDTEERATAHLVAHDGLHVVLRVEALLDVIGEVEVAVVEEAVVHGRCRRLSALFPDLCGERQGGEHQADEENVLVRGVKGAAEHIRSR